MRLPSCHESRRISFLAFVGVISTPITHPENQSTLPQGAEAFGLTLALDKGWDDHLARMRAAAHEE